MIRSLLALALSAALLALGIPELRARIAARAKTFAICRVGWDVKFRHDILCMTQVDLDGDRTTGRHTHDCARCEKRLKDEEAPLPEATQKLLRELTSLTLPTGSIMGMDLVDQQGYMN